MWFLFRCFATLQSYVPFPFIAASSSSDWKKRRMASEWKERVVVSKLAPEDKQVHKIPTDHLTGSLVCFPHFNKPDKYSQFYMKWSVVLMNQHLLAQFLELGGFKKNVISYCGLGL